MRGDVYTNKLPPRGTSEANLIAVANLGCEFRSLVDTVWKRGLCRVKS